MRSVESPARRHLLDRIRQDRLVTRRDYLRMLITVSGGLFAGTAAVAMGVFRRLPVGGAGAKRIVGELAPGDSVHFSYPGEDDPAIAVRLPTGRVVAFSAVCSHLSCAVLWIRESGRIECPCHDGIFDPRNGSVVAGPPPRPLTRIRIEEREDGIFATGVEA
jgi:Rieske Fe-S protein